MSDVGRPVSPGTPERVMPYGGRRPKGRQVEEMFDSIAPAYDFMNTAMTFGMHRRWLRRALDACIPPEGEAPASVVDVATGTGEVAFRLARMLPDAGILGVDLSEGMLSVARSRAASMPEGNRIEFRQGDCMALDCPDASFDLLTVAYGVRNFEDLQRGLKEFCRVLRPGGRCMILELSRPENRLTRLGYDLYTHTVVPLLGRLVSKDRRAYSYLPESIAAMPSRSGMAGMLREAGFRNVAYKSLTLGVVTFYIAEK